MSRPAHHFTLLAAAALLTLCWMLSIADPCVLAALRGGPLTSANPIAITSCVTTESGILITNGGAIVRVGALALLMGLFGLVGGLLNPRRRKLSIAGLAALGAACGFTLCLPIQAIAYGGGVGVFNLITGVTCVIVSWLAGALGAAMAESTVSS